MQPQRLGGTAGLARPGGDGVAGGEAVGVVVAQDPLPVGKQFAVQPQRLGGIAGLARPVGDVVAKGEGVGVVGSERVLDRLDPGLVAGEVDGWYRVEAAIESGDDLVDAACMV